MFSFSIVRDASVTNSGIAAATIDLIESVVVAAGELWSRYIDAPNADIVVSLSFVNLANNALASAGPTFISTDGGVTFTDLVHDQLASDTDIVFSNIPIEASITIDLQSLLNGDYYLDPTYEPNPSGLGVDQFDLLTVLSHEWAHILGILTSLDPRFQINFEDLIVNTAPPGDFEFFFTGANAVAENGGNLALDADDLTMSIVEPHVLAEGDLISTGILPGVRLPITPLHIAILEDIGNPIVEASTGDDVLYGFHERDDTLLGQDGDDMLFGLSGDDALDGGLGNDTLDGGDGVDTADFTARTEDFVANLNSGVALITGGETNSLTSIENFIGGSGDDTVFGSGEDNVLTGNAGEDLLAGLDGIDTLNGGAGIDSLSGGNGNDILNGGDGDDRLFGNNDNDTIMGGAGNDFTNGGNGDDTIFGGDDDDTVLVGGNGNDEIHGEDGNDAINGSAGDDDLFGEEGNDNLFGGDGEDTLNGGNGNDTLGGLGDNDLIIGGAGDDGIGGGGGDDNLFGFSGNDTIFGGLGDDVLNGGTGDDLLRGQSGDDTFVFSNNWGNDQIAGYGELTGVVGAPRIDETIDLSSLLDSGGNAVDFADLTFTQSGNHTIITVDGHAGNSIEVLFRSIAEFTVDDFAFG